MSKLPQKIQYIKTQPLLEIDYRYQKSISYSQFSTYKGCPYKWKLQYRDGVETPSFSIHTCFGTALHETLQHYLTVLYDESVTKADSIDLEEFFKERFIEQYQIAYKQNKNTHFSSSEELREFHDDGNNIIDWVKKHRSEYFGKNGWNLVGCEIPIILPPDSRYKNLIYKGYLDLILYHEPTDTVKIIDIKTSTRGWGEKDKKDELKQFQLILYKAFLSKHFNIDPDKIEVEFFIVKRKLYEESEFPQRRVQIFTPPSGKIKTKKAITSLTEFIEETFNTDGTFKDREYNKVTTNCKWCPFADKKELCNRENLNV
jgi:hypothetical protein